VNEAQTGRVRAGWGPLADAGGDIADDDLATGIGAFDTGQDLHGRRLARAVAPEQGVDLTWSYLQEQRVQRQIAGVGLAQPAHRQGGARTCVEHGHQPTPHAFS